jgi:hypothetical protein
MTRYHSHPSPFINIKVQTSHHHNKNSSMGDDNKLSLNPIPYEWLQTLFSMMDGYNSEFHFSTLMDIINTKVGCG